MNKMTNSALKAKKILLGILGILLLVDIVTQILWPDPVKIVRFVLTICLFWCVYQGYSWAKSLTIILIGLGGIVLLLTGNALMGKDVVSAIMLILGGVASLAISAYLLKSKDLEEYYSIKREQRNL